MYIKGKEKPCHGGWSGWYRINQEEGGEHQSQMESNSDREMSNSGCFVRQK